MYAILQLFVVYSKGTVQQKLTEVKDGIDQQTPFSYGVRDYHPIQSETKNFQLWAITSYF